MRESRLRTCKQTHNKRITRWAKELNSEMGVFVVAQNKPCSTSAAAGSGRGSETPADSGRPEPAKHHQPTNQQHKNIRQAVAEAREPRCRGKTPTNQPTNKQDTNIRQWFVGLEDLVAEVL